MPTPTVERSKLLAVRRPPHLARSLLRAGVPARLGLAAVASACLWLAIGWALA